MTIDILTEITNCDDFLRLRAELRRNISGYIQKLLYQRHGRRTDSADTEAKYPNVYHHLLNRARWNADILRDALQKHVLGLWGDPLYITPTCWKFFKKGPHSAGAQRMHASKFYQQGIFLIGTTESGQVLLDRHLLCPGEITEEIVLNQIQRLQRQVPSQLIVVDVDGQHELTTRMMLERSCIPFKIKVFSSPWPEVSCGITDLINSACLTDDKQIIPIRGAPHSWTREVILQKGKDTIDTFAVYRQNCLFEHIIPEKSGTRVLEDACATVGLDAYETRSPHGWYRHMTMAIIAYYLRLLRY